MEYTLGIIKPNAVEKGYTGKILSRIEDFDFTLEAIRLLQLSTEDAERFYAAVSYTHLTLPTNREV